MLCILYLQHVSIWTRHTLNAQQPHLASGYWPAAMQVDGHPIHNHISKYLNHNGNKRSSEGGNSAESVLGKRLWMLQVRLEG